MTTGALRVTTGKGVLESWREREKNGSLRERENEWTWGCSETSRDQKMHLKPVLRNYR